MGKAENTIFRRYFPLTGHTIPVPGRTFDRMGGKNMRVWPLALGVGAAAGAVTVMMLPKQSTMRRMAYQAAEKVEDAMTTAANRLVDKVTQ